MNSINVGYARSFERHGKKVLIILATVLLFSSVYAQQPVENQVKTTAIGTSKVWGTVNGVAIEGLVQGPAAVAVPLQVACVFEYTEGDIFNPPALPAALNGMVHLDEALKGLITEVRKSGKFAGHALETLLITPPKGTTKATRILLIGLGDRSKFTPDLMTSVGSVALREAVRLGVSHFAFASDIKDAGIDSPTALVASNVTKGIIAAYRTQLFLQGKKYANGKPLTKVTLLAGPAFFNTAGEGIKEAVASFSN
ncbi:M17 family peptidase N-terminal domain-containing protein [Chitinophaga ginsengisoli]|uniref:Cytosol aminopeptidase family protein n=1 Tax=Chitinophaga ginsengisoli TaxID=363837 RepID=A0A2P8GAM2_9BACT|nr:M17 family peptidase N-terminal domain-containing protein [Chitinophaga ginsengisoli]PSL31029.1 cytosol aminopeptidase family protein [Chitinophaga ginsengisoli]